jgi:hypothetical protein
MASHRKSKRGRVVESEPISFVASGHPVDISLPWLTSVPSAKGLLDSATITQGETLSQESSASSACLIDENGKLIHETPIFTPLMKNGEVEVFSEFQALKVYGETAADIDAAVPTNCTLILTISSTPWWIIIVIIIIKLAKAFSLTNKRIVILFARESDSHHETLFRLRQCIQGLTNIDFVTVTPTTSGENVALYIVRNGKIFLDKLSLARDPNSFGNATSTMLHDAEIKNALPLGSMKFLQQRALTGTGSNGCRDDHGIVTEQVKVILEANPAFTRLFTENWSSELIDDLQKGSTARADVAANPKDVCTTENYVIFFKNKLVTVSKVREEMKKGKYQHLRGLGCNDIEEQLDAEIRAGRGHLPFCFTNSGVTAMFPKLPKAGSGLRDYRRYDMHFDGNGNTLIVWLVAVVNGVSPGSATSLNSVFVAVRGSNSDLAYTREWIIGIFLDSQQGAYNLRNKLSPSLGNVVVSGANFISPGKSEKDPLTLASKLACGDLGGNTLAWCITDQSSHRGAAYLVDMLLKYYPDETKDSVLELTAKNAYSLYAQYVGKLGGKAVQDSRAAFLLLAPPIQSAMNNANMAELIEHRDALRMPANGRFVRAAGQEASVQGLGRSDARTTAVGAAIGMGWHVRCALRIPGDEEITPEALQASGSVITSEMGLASAEEYRRLVESDAAGTLTPAEQEKFRLWHEAYCETSELRSKSMIGVMKVSRELAAKAREKTNFKTLR